MRIERARVLPGEVLAIRDHFRLRLRPPGQGDPVHEPGSDARTPRADPDTAVLTVFAYRFWRGGSRGHVAVLDGGVAPAPVTLTDDAALARHHAALDEAWGYTPLPHVQQGSLRWVEGPDSIRVELELPGFAIRAAVEGLGPPAFIAGNHPRDRGVSYFASMREAQVGWLEINGARVDGDPFLHRGYEPWLGHARRSAAVQIGETLVTRLRAARS
jgi:hypothetical protein